MIHAPGQADRARGFLYPGHYTQKMKTTILLALLLAPGATLAIEPPEEVDLDKATTEPLDVGEEPYELEEFTVTSEQFTLAQETALRWVRQLLKEKKSFKREDRDKWVCWFRKPAGKHRTHLECARNGDLQALQPDSMLTGPGRLDRASIASLVNARSAVNPGYGTIYQSTRPVSKKQFRELLDSLPGSDDLDREFVARRLAGKDTPRDIPSDAELDAFAEAYGKITELDETGGSEQKLLAAIEDAGLTISRYNRMVDLVETYQSLENEVAMRLGTWQPPQD